MDYKEKTIAGAVASVVSAVPTWIGMFLDHPEALDWLFSTAPIWTPVMVFSFGCFTGYSFCKWKSGADAYRELTRNVPSLSERERAVLLVAYSMGDVWARDDMVGVAASLLANGYLHLTHSGGLRGDCYVMPSELRKELRGNRRAVEAMNAASGVLGSWGYKTSPR